jgi:hypothetical protein
MEWTYFAFLIGNLVGILVKHKTDWNNKLIPAVIYIVQVAVRFAAGLELGGEPGEPEVAMAGFWDSLGAVGTVGLWNMAAAAVDTGLAMFAHGLSQAVAAAKRKGLRNPPSLPGGGNYVPGEPEIKY